MKCDLQYQGDEMCVGLGYRGNCLSYHLQYQADDMCVGLGYRGNCLSYHLQYQGDVWVIEVTV